MKIGYARVSTDEQNLHLQQDALTSAGCDQIFADEGISGTGDPHKRSGFADAMAALGSGDTFVVWKLDRMGRSLGALITLMGEFQERDIEFQSLSDGIDTRTAGGRLVFHIMGALAEFERDLISDRTKAGMRAAKRRGKHVGRPAALTHEQIALARHMIDTKEETRGSMAKILNVSRTALYKALKE